MNTDLDFKNIGKSSPYEVPEGFFDQITGKTLAEAKRRELHRISVRRKYWLAAVSLTGVAALVVFGLFTDLNRSVINNNFAADSLVNIGVSAQNGQINSDSSSGVNISEKSINTTAGNGNEIDKLLSSLTDEEIKLLADLSYSDVFFDQPQQ